MTLQHEGVAIVVTVCFISLPNYTNETLKFLIYEKKSVRRIVGIHVHDLTMISK